MKQEIEISVLDPTDKKSILKIAHWYLEEWDTPIERTVHRLSNQSGKNTLFQLVLSSNNEIVATGGLCNNVSIYKVHEQLRKFNPWVGLLYTVDDYRNRGFGTMVLNQMGYYAKELGFKKIYLYTFTAESLYERSGWTKINQVFYKNHDTAVMEKNI